MQLVTVGQKYQVVIPKEVRTKIKSIKPGSKVVVKAGQKNSVIVKPQKRRWSDQTYGLMKNAWKEIDIEAEIEKMRDEWDKK